MNYLQIVGNHRIKLDTVDSTNDYAIKQLSKTNPIDGTVISAQYQTAGKGQYGRQWYAAPKESILLSLILKPNNLFISDVFYLNIAITLALQQFVASYVQEKITIKWPNDIYVNDKKIAGVLIQNQINEKKIASSVIGIGININQDTFDIKDANPISLKQITGNHWDIEKLILELFSNLNKYYFILNRNSFDTIKNEYLNVLYKIHIPSQFLLADGGILKGIIRDISKNGSLLIESDGVTKPYMHHELSMIFS